MENGKKTAELMYGCKGFVAHHNTDIHGDTVPQDHYPYAALSVRGQINSDNPVYVPLSMLQSLFLLRG